MRDRVEALAAKGVVETLEIFHMSEVINPKLTL